MPAEHGVRFPFLSVQDNLRIVVDRLRTSEARRRFDEVLAAFPLLRGRLRTAAGDLSGGQQKLLEFAKALIVRPRLCLRRGTRERLRESVYRQAAVRLFPAVAA